MAKPPAPDRLEPLKNALKSAEMPGGAWLLCGQESYLSAYYLSLLRKKIIPDPDMGYFDHIRINGSDRGGFADEQTLSDRLASAVEGLPVMNEGKLIEISEPGFSDMKQADLAAFCAVLETLGEFPYVTVAILCAEEEFQTVGYGAENASTWKALEKSGMHIVPFPLQTEAKLIPWCEKHFASEGITAARPVISAMIARVGCPMTSLAGEMQKLCAYLHAHGRTEATQADVLHVCASSEQAGEFDLRNAIYSRDIGALTRVYRVRKNEKVDAMSLFFQISSAIGDLYRVKLGLSDGYSKEELMRICKMKEYPMKLAVAACAKYSEETLTALARLCEQTDIQLKSSSIDPYIPVERLICAMSQRYESALAAESK